MRKLFFVIIAFSFLNSISAYAQRADFIGYYAQYKETNDDTDVHILISLDSVTEIRAIKTNRDRDMWMEIKSGSWIIREHDTVKQDYWITLLFDNGSSKDLHFKPTYPTFPPPKWMQPSSYIIDIGDYRLQKIRGKDGFNNRVRNNINSRKM